MSVHASPPPCDLVSDQLHASSRSLAKPDTRTGGADRDVCTRRVLQEPRHPTKALSFDLPSGAYSDLLHIYISLTAHQTSLLQQPSPRPPSVLLIGLPWDHPTKSPTPDDAPSEDALIAQMRERSYDGVMIGFEVRGAPELTLFFEKTLNAVKDTVPTARSLFNSSPPSMLMLPSASSHYNPILVSFM